MEFRCAVGLLRMRFPVRRRCLRCKCFGSCASTASGLLSIHVLTTLARRGAAIAKSSRIENFGLMIISHKPARIQPPLHCSVSSDMVQIFVPESFRRDAMLVSFIPDPRGGGIRNTSSGSCSPSRFATQSLGTNLISLMPL